MAPSEDEEDEINNFDYICFRWAFSIILWALMLLAIYEAPAQAVMDTQGLTGQIIKSRIVYNVTHVLVQYDFGKYGVYLCDTIEHDSYKAFQQSIGLQKESVAEMDFPEIADLWKNYITKKDFNAHKR